MNHSPSQKSRRPQRVADLVKEEVARYLLDGLKNQGIGFITITGVKMTPDLQVARIYYTVFGSDSDKEASRVALEESNKEIRQHLGHILKLRYTPRLEFFVDEALEESYKINDLLNSVKS